MAHYSEESGLYAFEIFRTQYKERRYDLFMNDIRNPSIKQNNTNV